MKAFSYAKINIFLKIVGYESGYHKIYSRFVKFKKMYDIIKFNKKYSKSNKFIINGKFSCHRDKNSIFKAYNALIKYSKNERIRDFFRNNSVEVIKNIPEGSGLGGASSNAASFLKLTDRILNLKIPKTNLIKIAQEIGSDVSFFIYEYQSANVSGFGEIVEKFYEEPVEIKILTSPIKVNTKDVYTIYKKTTKTNKYKNTTFSKKLKHKSSLEILKENNPFILNDLIPACLNINPTLKKHIENGWYLTGSGATLFRACS